MEEFPEEFFPEDVRSTGDYILDAKDYEISSEEKTSEEEDEAEEPENDLEYEPSKVKKKTVRHAHVPHHKIIVPEKNVTSQGGRRKTVFELDSFMPTLRKSIMSFDSSKLSGDTDFDDDMSADKLRTRSTSVSGKVRLKISPLTQKIIGCEIGENLTEEYPWIEVDKQLIEDNIHLHPEKSDFLPVAAEILCYPGDKILIGYNPQVKAESQFMVCVTEEARAITIQGIQAVRLEREAKVRNAVNKKPNKWESLGSEKDVETNLDGTRELFSFKHEITIKYPRRKLDFIDRNSEGQRDSYIELNPIHTETFENVEKKLLNISVQNCPLLMENETQTTVHHLVDGFSQYSFDDLPTYDVSDKKMKRDMALILRKLKEVDTVLSKQNRSWDIYKDDLQQLTTSPKLIKF